MPARPLTARHNPVRALVRHPGRRPLGVTAGWSPRSTDGRAS